MKYRFAAIAAAVFSLEAQIQHLTTDFTGSVLYFASTHRECGRDDEPQSKIFRWTAGEGVRTYLSRSREWQPPNARGDRWTNFYSLDSPSVTSDGTRLAYVGHQDCQCRMTTLRFAEVDVRRGESVLFREQRSEPSPQVVQTEISRNGLFLLFRWGHRPNGLIGSRELISPGPRFFSYGGAPSVYGDQTIDTRQMLADNGWGPTIDENQRLVLVTEPDRPPGQPTPPKRPLPASDRAASWAINAAGTKVIYETLLEDGRPRLLFAIDLATNHETFLFTDGVPDVTGLSLPIATPFNPLSFFAAPYLPLDIPRYAASMDDSGERVIALAREQPGAPKQWIVLLRSDGSETRWLAFAPEGHREAILSGDGKWIFAVSNWGRLLRIDAMTGREEELLPRTPWVRQLAGSLWRGSRNRIAGGGFATETWEVTEYPAPTEAAGVRVEFNGQPLPLLKVSPTEIVYQIPWEFPGFNPEFGLSPAMTVRIVVPHESRLKIPTITLPGGSANSAAFEEPGAIRENGEPVTLAKPARPGEVIRAFASGFDRPRGRTGFPASAEEAARPGLQCHVDFDPNAISSAGLAVGRIGLYEVVARLPDRFSDASMSQGSVVLGCSDSVDGGIARLGGFGIPISP